MQTVTLSTKYQFVIPRDIRRRLELEPGAKLTVVEKGGILQAGPGAADRGDAGHRSRHQLQGLAREEGSQLILVDSSGWIEYLAARPKAGLFALYIEGPQPLVSSAIQVYEIYKIVRRDLNEERAIAAVSALRTTTIEPLAESLALEAADVALEHGLAMAEAIIFATAARREARIATGDVEFDRLPRVTLLR